MLDPIIIGRNIQHRIQQYPVNTTYNNDKIWTMDLPAQVGSRDDALTTVEQNCLAIWIIICDKTYSIRNTYRFFKGKNDFQKRGEEYTIFVKYRPRTSIPFIQILIQDSFFPKIWINKITSVLLYLFSKSVVFSFFSVINLMSCFSKDYFHVN